MKLTEIQLPQQLLTLLSRDSRLEAFVRGLLSYLDPWFYEGPLTFFSEYTDHGPKHIASVLATAASLPTEAAWDVMSPGDAAVIVLATVLHDCAMHLREHAFTTLVSGDFHVDNNIVKDDLPWHKLWEAFLVDASRFSGRQLTDLFGDDAPITAPHRDYRNWTLRDRQLIGDFLRRYHHRLAFDIAFRGFPGDAAGPSQLYTLHPDSSDILALSGLVARSHGEALRNQVPHLQQHFNHRDYKGIHALYAMVLLRLADYLQLQASRAPGEQLTVAPLLSPVSKQEWAAHSGIRDIRNSADDPELVFLDVLPPSMSALLKVRDWQLGIQQELDTSWAVLGEVYGRISPLNTLGIRLRRVGSTLDDIRGLAGRLQFIPLKASLTAADSELIRLLIRPLYGDTTECGVRELLQNALDATRERACATPADTDALIDNATVLLEITKKEDGHWIQVVDHGIGMTPDTVVNYFLRAGASFRRSREWKELFSAHDTDKPVTPVRRNGRFGVGALAGFLLGDELHVSTRHYRAETGCQFTVQVGDSNIALLPCTRHVGTTISIKLSATAARRLLPDANQQLWDWYTIANPQVRRISVGTELKQRIVHPTPEDKPLPDTWHALSHPPLDSVLWSHSAPFSLSINGILIPGGLPRLWPRSEFVVNQPGIAIFDSGENIPLTLKRDTVSASTLSFADPLRRAVTGEYLQWIDDNRPESVPTSSKAVWGSSLLRYKGVAHVKNEGSTLQRPLEANKWVYTAEGCVFCNTRLIYESGIRSVVFSAATDHDNRAQWSANHLETCAVGVERGGGSNYELLQRLRRYCDLAFASRYLFHPEWDGEDRVPSFLLGLPKTAVRLVLRTELRQLFERLPKFIRNVARHVVQGDVHIVELGPTRAFSDEAVLLSEEIMASTSGKSFAAAVSWEERECPKTSEFASMWLERFGRATLPYSAN